MTSQVQPFDCGIIRAFKAYYRKALMVRSVDRLQAGEEDPYAINQPEAIRMAEAAWGMVTRTTVVNCWRKSSILPQTPRQSWTSAPVETMSTLRLTHCGPATPFLRQEPWILTRLQLTKWSPRKGRTTAYSSTP